jgi:hypothetical protein
MKGKIIGPISLLIGIIILKIFLPSWLVLLLTGSVIVAAVYCWVIRKTQINPSLARKIAIIAIVFFVLSAGLNLTEKKWPWLERALNNLQIYASFWATDKIDPGYDARAALEKYKTRELLIAAEMEKQIRIQKDLQAKILRGETIDESLISKSEKGIEELQEELRKMRLARQNKQRAPGTMGSVNPKIFLFGICIFGFGIGLQMFTKKEKGGGLVGLGIFILFIWGFLALFGEDILSSTGGQVNATPPPVTKNSPIVKYQTFRYVLKAGEPSAEMYVIPSGRPYWAAWCGPEEAQMLDREGRVLGPLLKDYSGSELLKGVRFQSPKDCIVIVLQAIRHEDLPPYQKIKEIWEKEQEQYLQAKANSPPPKPPELVYLGKELKQLKFRENQYFVRSAQWYIRLMSVGIVDGGKLRLDFLHIASKRGNVQSRPGTVWIDNPDATMYLTDKAGNKLYYAGEKNFGGTKIGRQGPYIGGNELPPEVPYAYSFIFSKPEDDTRVVNFVSKYSWCWNYFNNGCMNSEKIDVVIGNINLFKEKRQIAEGDVPFEKGEIAHSAM